MIKTLFLILVFVPLNFAVGYLVAVRLRLAPPTFSDSVAITRELAHWLVVQTEPARHRIIDMFHTCYERLEPLRAKAIAWAEQTRGRVTQLKERLIPVKKVTVDIGAQGLVVEPTLEEAVIQFQKMSVLDLIDDKMRFVVGGAGGGGGKWDDAGGAGGGGGGKGGSFMLKKRRLEQLRTGQHLVDMEKRFQSLRVTPDTAVLVQLLGDFSEDAKQILTLLANLSREAKARAPYAGGKLTETVSLLDRLTETMTPPIQGIVDTVTVLEGKITPAEEGSDAPQQIAFTPEEVAAHLAALEPLFHELVVARHQIRDLQADINALYARLDTNFEDLKPEDLVNAVLRISNRTGFDAALAGWWKENVAATGRVAMGVVDLCQTQRLNEEITIPVVDRVLRYLSRELKEAFVPATSIVGLLRGSCLVVANRQGGFAGMNRALSSLQKRVNQTAVQWTSEGSEVGAQSRAIQVTCAAVGIPPKLGEAESLARLCAALDAAKAAGAGSFLEVSAEQDVTAVTPSVPEISAESTVSFSLDELELWDEIDTTTARLEKSPQDTTCLTHRATMYLRIAKIEAALQDLDATIAAEPEKILHYLHRGLVRQSRSDYQGALDDLSKIFELQPVHATALKYRAIVEQIKGDTAAAQTDYQQLLMLVSTA